MAEDLSDLFDDDLNLFEESTPELDFEQVLDTQKQVKQAQETMQMQAEAKKKQEEDNPRNWSSEQFKDFYKQNPPKNIEEQSRANVMVDQAKEREKMMEDSLMGKEKESPIARLSAKALIALSDHPVVRAAEQAFRARPDAGKDLLGMEYDEPITSQVSRRQHDTLQQVRPTNPFLEEIASGVGRLAGETPGLVASFGATKGLGVGAKALSEGARRFVPQLPYYVNRIVHRATGFGLNRLGTSVLQGLQDGHLDPKEVAKETAQDAAFGAGLGVVGAAPSLSQRVLRGALYGGATAVASGGSAEDIVFQAGLFAGFELLGGKGPTMARKMDAFKSVEDNYAEYMVKSGRVSTVAEARTRFRVRLAGEMKAEGVEPTPENLVKIFETQPLGKMEAMAKKVAQDAYEANPVKTAAEAKALEAPAEAKPAAPKAAEAKAPATSEPATVIPATKLATKDQADLMVDHRQASFPQYDHVAIQAGTGWEVRSYEKGKAPKVETPTPALEPVPPAPAPEPAPPAAPAAPEPLAPKPPEEEIFQNVPTFYSQLQKSIDEKMPSSSTPQQVIGILNSSGVKKEEAEWLDIDGFLKGKEKVSKQELLDFIRSNNVQVQEVEKSKINPNIDSDGGPTQQALEEYAQRMFDSSWDQLDTEERQDVHDAASENYKGGEQTDTTKFSSYQLPGGENYREIVVTIPSIKPEFTGGHFDEKNVVVHIRASDYVDTEEKKVLVLQEVQSDWHQKGRKEGYVGKVDEYGNKIPEGYHFRENTKDHPTAVLHELVKDSTGEVVSAGIERSEAIKKAGFSDSQIPNAPFKKSWHELALKRMLRYAAENGYDKLAWTTGEQQVSRYREALQKVVDKIEWVKSESGIRLIGFKDGEKVVDTLEKENSISDAIGKSMGDKIIQSQDRSGVFKGDDITISDTGMAGFYDQMIPSFLNRYTKKWGGRVGTTSIGEGQGVIIDNETEDVVAEFPTVQAAQGAIDSGKYAGQDVRLLKSKASNLVHAIDITPSMKKAVLQEGQPLFQRNLEGQPSTFEAESQKLKSLIGKHGIENLTVALVNEIKTPSGELAKGSYRPSERTVKMVSEPLDTTAYHEGFHVLAREARTSDKIADVIGEYKAQHGLGDKEAEEKLADDFARYANQKDATGLSARIKRFFDEILAYIRNLFGKGKARKLFEELLNPKPRRNPIEERLVDAIDAAKPMRSRQEAIYTKARAQRIARLLGVRQSVKGEAGFHAELGQLKGEMPKVDYEAVRNKFTQQDVDYLFDAINGSTLGAFESITAKAGLAKILGPEGGAVPTEGEIKLLNKVFGPELTRALMEKRTMGQKAWQVTEDLLNVPRTIMASFDLSAPLRQGAFLVGRPQQWFPAFGKMFKMFASEKVYRASQSEIESRPTYELMKDSGLSITELEAPALTDREERFMSNIAEKIPGLGIVIRASGRAYTGFLNKLRADTFDAILKETEKAGVEQTPEFHKDLAKFINTATGRGETPSILKGAEPALNATIFSPKLMFSRLRLLNPAFYVKLEPSIRKEALRSLLSFAGAGMIVLGLAKLAGMKVGTDPRSADFGKFKTGDTRYDPWGGFQQPIVAASRLLTGQMVSSTTGREMFLGEGYKPTTRLDIIQRYLASKEAPLMSLAMTMLEGKSFGGEKLNLPAEVADRFIPIFVADMYELIREEGAEGIPMALPGAFGVGVLTYGEQIPMLESTPTGKPSVKWRGKPSLGEDIVNKAQGKEVSNIPEEKWEGLRKMHDLEIQKQIALDVARRRVLETGKPQFAAGKEVYLEDGIVKKKEAKLDEVPELF